ncbi:MAG TPA: hypothetical protein VKC65_09260 [Gaiellaceae bacterium]|nr:hypothetical protein [Gaiellaceae bacterium]
MSDDATIMKHLENLLWGVEPDRRDHARDHLEGHGWFPIAEFVHNYDARWAELVGAQRHTAEDVGRRLSGASIDRWVLIEEGGRRTRIVTLDDALTRVDESSAPFVISCASGRYIGPNYYDGGGSDPSQFFVGFGGGRSYLEGVDWLAVFRTLAERKARFLGAFGLAFIEPRLTETRWRELWLQTITGSLGKRRFLWKKKEDEEYLNALWLEFAGAPVLRLEAAEAGVFRHIQFDKRSPTPGEPAYPDAGDWVVELTSLPPFVDVAGTPLRGIKVISEADDRKRFPWGIRLQFERGDVWIMGTLMDMYIYGQRPPWFRRGHEFAEW